MEIEPLPDDQHPAWLLQQRYTFLRPLQHEESGYGEIYQVRVRERGECYALKIVRPTTAQPELAREMLEREGRLLGGLQHPHIVRLVRDRSDGSEVLPHLLLEYVPGPSLEVYLKRRGDPITRLRLALGIASAVAYLHARDLQHNDLHPLNVVVDEGALWPVLIDFGLTLPQGAMEESLRQVGRAGWAHPDVIDGQPFSEVTEKYELARLISFVLGLEEGGGDLWPEELTELVGRLQRGESEATAAELAERINDHLLHCLAADGED